MNLKASKTPSKAKNFVPKGYGHCKFCSCPAYREDPNDPGKCINVRPNQYPSLCGHAESSHNSSVQIEVPIKNESDAPKKAKPISCKSGVYAQYGFGDSLFWAGDRLHGTFAAELSTLCSNAGTNGFYYRIQILSGPDSVGSCSGRPVVKVTVQG